MVLIAFGIDFSANTTIAATVLNTTADAITWTVLLLLLLKRHQNHLMAPTYSGHPRLNVRWASGRVPGNSLSLTFDFITASSFLDGLGKNYA